MKKLKIKPLADRIIVLPQKIENITSGGIIIPENAKEKPQEGTVVAVGNGTAEEKMDVKAGDVVLYGKSAGIDIKIDDEDYLIMKQSDLLAVITNMTNK